MAIKTYTFDQVLSGFNEDLIIANKPTALLKGLNLDLESCRGSIKKRKGSYMYGSQIVNNYDVLGLYDFTKSTGSRVALASINNTISVTNASYADPVITLTVTAGHGVVAGDVIVVSGLAPSGYNGTFTVTEVAATSIKYEVAGLGALTDTTGSINSTMIYYYTDGWDAGTNSKGFMKDANTEFETFIGYCFATDGSQLKTSADGATWSNTNLLNTVDITAVAYDDPAVTLTVPGGHEVEVGDEITVSDLAPAGYNGTFTVTAVTETTIVYSSAGLGAVTDEEGSLTVQFSMPANDIVEYSNYLFLVGLEDYPSDIMWSKIPEKDDFSSSYTIEWSRSNNVSIRLGDGDELIAGIKYRGALYLFKNSSISRTIAPVDTNGIKDLTNNIGANSKRCIQVVGGQMIFFNDGKRNSKKGFYSFNSLSDAEPQIISEPMQHYIDGMTAGQVVVAGIINDLYIAYIGAVDNDDFDLSLTNCWLVYDTKTNRWLGAWDFPFVANVLAQLTVSNVTKLYSGDDDGVVCKLFYGTTDSMLSGASSRTIQMLATSQPYDISVFSKIRQNYSKATVKNIFIWGDNLNNVVFRYRFDKRARDKGGWQEASGLKMPVHVIPIKQVQANIFQFEIAQIGEIVSLSDPKVSVTQKDEPIIRKIQIEYE